MITTHRNLNGAGEVTGFTVEISNGSISDFQQLVARACNTWDFASPEIKKFHDLIVNGTMLQDYDTINQG